MYKDLLLEGEYVGDAAVDGVTDPSEGLVTEGDDGVDAAVGREPEEELGGVAGAEDLVHGGEVGCSLLRVEVGSEHAASHALPPQELAGAAGWPSASDDDDSSSSSSFSASLCFLHRCSLCRRRRLGLIWWRPLRMSGWELERLLREGQRKRLA